MIQLTDKWRIAGVERASGYRATLTVPEEASLVAQGVAIWVGANLAAAWTQVPTFFRLRLTGTGTVQVDARNRLGEETIAVSTYSASAATNDIVFQYLADDAVETRLSYPSTMSVEILS